MSAQPRRPRGYGEYVRRLMGHPCAVLLPVIVCALSVGLALSDTASIYESRATVSVENLAAGEGRSPEESLNAIRQKLSVESPTADSNNPDNKSAAVGLITPQNAPEPARLKVTLSESYGSTALITIAFRDADPVVAKEMAAKLVNQLVARKSVRPPEKEDPTDDQNLQERARQLSAQISSTEARYPWVLSGTAPQSSSQVDQHAPMSAPPDPTRQAKLETLKDKQSLIQQQLADIDKQIDAQKKLMEQQEAPKREDASASLLAKRAELQGQRETLLKQEGMTEDNPRIVKIDEQIRELSKQIEEARQKNNSRGPDSRQLTLLELEKRRITQELDTNHREISRISGGTASASFAHNPVNSTTRTSGSSAILSEYESLKRSLAEITARIQKPASEVPSVESDRYQLVEGASQSDSPVWPDRLLLVFGAALLGLLIGILLAIIIEYRQLGLVRDAMDVEYYGRMALLGYLPRLIPARERARVRLNAVGRVAVILALSAISTVALYKVLIITKLLERLG